MMMFMEMFMEMSSTGRFWTFTSFALILCIVGICQLVKNYKEKKALEERTYAYRHRREEAHPNRM